MNDKLRAELLERLNEVSKNLNVQILEIQSIASELRMDKEDLAKNEPLLLESQAEPVNQLKPQESQDIGKMQESIARLEELVLNMQKTPTIPVTENKKIPVEPKPVTEQNKTGDAAPKVKDEKPAPLVLDDSLMVKTPAPDTAPEPQPAVKEEKVAPENPKAEPLLLSDPVKS